MKEVWVMKRWHFFRKITLVMVALMGVFLWSGTAQAASFQGLGDLPGGSFFSETYWGVSADGSVVVGDSYSSSGQEAFRWTSGSGMVGLGDLPGGSFSSSAFGVSADGSVVVGYGTSSSGQEAFRWTLGTGMVGLGDLPGGSFGSAAGGVSADGSVVAGTGTSAAGWEPFRWTSGTGMVGLGSLSGGSSSGEGYGVSSDGAVVVGYSNSSSGHEAFRWNSGTGMVGLGGLTSIVEPSLPVYSEAFGVSADGSVVVGGSLSTYGFEAFRWTSGTGMVGLGDLAGGSFSSEAFGVSADGSVVVGFGTSASGQEAFIWDEVNGMRSLKDVLENEYGLDLTDWTLDTAFGISADGFTIVGVGHNPDGNLEAFRAVVPVPGSLLLLGTGLLGLGGLGWRRKRD
jgi:probable HAF family extracellular repeat protein